MLSMVILPLKQLTEENKMSNIEITITGDNSDDEMTAIASNQGISIDGDWMSYTPFEKFNFETTGGAKRSARNFFKGDGNDYFIIYEESEHGTNCFISKISK